MSFKGLQKSLVRAPQQFKSRFNIGESTKDAVYIDAERRFQELEKQTKKLHDESKKYFEAINGMLNHQIDFSKAMSDIYKPISGRVSDPDSLVPEGNSDGIHACEEYEAIVKELQETLSPELDMIETRIIRPANELLDVIKVIRKTAVKRDHKQLDYDRHRATLKKLQDKKDRSAKDEKAMWKAEGDCEQATEDFEYYNNLLKDELPKLFKLEQDFIRPLFQSFYYMQLNIFYTLHERMQRCDIGYFDLTRDIEEAFIEKRGDIQERAEALTIVRFKTTGQRRPPKFSQRPALESSQPHGLLTAGPTSSSSATTTTAAAAAATTMTTGTTSTATTAGETYSTPDSTPSWKARAAHAQAYNSHDDYASSSSPPPYTPPAHTRPGGSLAVVAAAKAKPPPPPKPKPSRLSAVPAAETVTALYDYNAQADGDLSFRAGDVIEIVSRTQNENEWWTGKIHGKTGQFPGNYVRVN